MYIGASDSPKRVDSNGSIYTIIGLALKTLVWFKMLMITLTGKYTDML